MIKLQHMALNDQVKSGGKLGPESQQKTVKHCSLHLLRECVHLLVCIILYALVTSWNVGLEGFNSP